MQYVCNQLASDNVTCVAWVAYEQPQLVDWQSLSYLTVVIILLWFVKRVGDIILRTMGF